MFQIKYNFLVIVQIVLGIVNYLLILRTFGVSLESDVYLLSISILLALFLIIKMPISQFIPYYNDLKVKSLKQSRDFYNSILCFAMIFSLMFCIILNIFLPLILKIFAFGLDVHRLVLLKKMLQILSFGLFFYPINHINEQLFNAEMKFSIPYILSCIPLSLIIITQIIMFFINSKNIIYLAIAQDVGLLGIALGGTIFISKSLIKFKIIKLHFLIKAEIKNSFILKSADMFNAIAIPVVFNNILVTFPNGYISYFYYSRKILDVINVFTLGPSSRILRSKISQFVAIGDSISIKKYVKTFVVYGSILFITVLIFTYYYQSIILSIVTSGKLISTDLKIIKYIFLTLVPWYLTVFLTVPFLGILEMCKKAKIVLISNIIFLIIFVLFLIILRLKFGIEALGISIFLAQVSNLILFIIFSKQMLKKLKNRKGERNGRTYQTR